MKITNVPAVIWIASACAVANATLVCVALADDLSEPRATDHRRVMYFVDDAGREQPVQTVAD